MDNSTTQNKTAASKEAFLTQLEQAFGLVATTCRKVGISRSTYYKWRKDDSQFADKADEVKELQKDIVEALILKKMKDGDTAMLIFYAKTQMKDRGYVERTEIVGKDGADLSFAKYDLSKLTDAQRQVLLSIGNDILNSNSQDTEITSDTFDT